MKLSYSLIDAALKAEKTNLLRWYLLIKVYDKEGTGRIDKSRFIETITNPNNDLFITKSVQYARKMIRQIKDIGVISVSNIDRNILYYRNSDYFVRSLNGKKIFGQGIILDTSILTKEIKFVNAFFYDCFLSINSGKNISRATIEKETGFDPRTQRIYDGIRRITKEFNFMYAGTNLKEAKRYEKFCEEDDSKIAPAFKLGDVLVRQTVNTYRGTVNTFKQQRNKKLLTLLGIVITVLGKSRKVFYNKKSPKSTNETFIVFSGYKQGKKYYLHNIDQLIHE